MEKAAEGIELSDLGHCVSRAKINGAAECGPDGRADLSVHAARDRCPAAIGGVIYRKVDEGLVDFVAESSSRLKVFSVVAGSKGEVSGTKWGHLQPSILIVSGENFVFRRIDGEFHIFSRF